MAPKIKTADGYEIPSLGWGVWGITSEADFKEGFNAAIDNGYRLIDTAQAYHNEKYLGECIKNSSIDRKDLYITTKIAVQNFGQKKVASSFERSMEALQLEYVDLLLLHFPVSVLRKKSWQVLTEKKKTGRVRSIGVSNYTVRHLKEMSSYSDETPVVNQVELHVFLQQPDLIKYCHDNNIVIEAYSPLAHGNMGEEEIIQKIADKYKKSYAQIMLKFLNQQGLVVIPKSTNPIRIKENMDIFDFKLSGEEMENLKTLDRNYRTCWNPTPIP